MGEIWSKECEQGRDGRDHLVTLDAEGCAPDALGSAQPTSAVDGEWAGLALRLAGADGLDDTSDAAPAVLDISLEAPLHNGASA